jgi:hypothetical protein
VQRGPHIQGRLFARRITAYSGHGNRLEKKMSRLAKKIADVRFLRLTLWNNLLVSAGKRAHDLYALALHLGCR